MPCPSVYTKEVTVYIVKASQISLLEPSRVTAQRETLVGGLRGKEENECENSYFDRLTNVLATSPRVPTRSKNRFGLYLYKSTLALVFKMAS